VRHEDDEVIEMKHTNSLTTTTPRRDRGSVMVLVLVLMVIGSLVTIPILKYASTVLRANRVVSERTAEAEAVKAGFRMAMAEPGDLYDRCSGGSTTLPDPGLSLSTTTVCYQLEALSAVANSELPYSMATVFVGQPAVTGAGDDGMPYPGPSPFVDESSWLDDTELTRTAGKVWMPNLPVHGLNIRPGTNELPAAYIINGDPTCEVMFPGTYKQPLTLDSPTYMTSGIYYFEDILTIAGGATVVAGQGIDTGCGNDQLAAFYAENAPATHNINGLGVTLVFGDLGRLVIDDSTGPVEFIMNQRYVAPDDDGVASSAKVSIMTVNGDLDEALEATDFEASGIPLEIPGQLAVPLSLVGTETTRVAPEDQYRPTLHTPEPREPSEPLNVQSDGRQSAAVVTWDAPIIHGGAEITSYSVTASPGGASCLTSGQTECAILGLDDDTDYTYTVIATNVHGDSVPSLPSSPVEADGPEIKVPNHPTDIEITEVSNDISLYSEAFEVKWDAPGNDGNAPIDYYLVEVSDGTNTWICETDGETECVVDGITVGPTPPGFTISVTARNAFGLSAPEVKGPFWRDLMAAETGPPPPVPPTYFHTPDAIVDITTTTSNQVTVVIPGYISVPQGVVQVAVADPAASRVELAGGVLSAWSDVAGARPNDFTYGLDNPTTQRKIRIVTTLNNGSNTLSDAVVQVNETGGWAVNSWQVQSG
jgi:hypothetical protein